ncbi:MAG: Ku protein [Chloroflexi bacterium]|nr:Ku protein [Chloroflexota bacterium]
MPRAFWKGAISFGMVVIPVKMYVATESRAISFHLLHKKCLTRPRQVLYCELDNEYFGVKDTVRGYEYAKGQFVVLTESDFEKVPIRTNHTIDIMGFVRASEIDPVYYYDSHYLEAEAIGLKPYSLLREVLKKTGRVGIAKVSFQKREHLCSVEPREDILVLHTIHYSYEVRPVGELAPPRQELSASEMEMASALVNAMTRDFTPADYRDDYREALEKVIEAKVQGREVTAPKPVTVEIPDLMAALRASIEAAQSRQAAPAASTAAKG